MSILLEERKKIYVTLLGKLYLPDEIDEDKIRSLKLLVADLRRVRLLFIVHSLIYLMSAAYFLGVAPTVEGHRCS